MSMGINMSVNQYHFKKKRSLSLRIWHWLNALVILGLLGTVLLRKTFLSWRTNSALIQSELQETGVHISADLAKSIAVHLRDPMWDWHYVLGFCLIGLMVFRVIIGFTAAAQSPSLEFFRLASQFSKTPAKDRFKAIHYGFAKLSYGIFYLIVFIMMITGLALYFKSDLGLAKNWIDSIKEFHELMMWFFVIFSVSHLLGVIITENREAPGLVSSMIHGKDDSKNHN